MSRAVGRINGAHHRPALLHGCGAELVPFVSASSGECLPIEYTIETLIIYWNSTVSKTKYEDILTLSFVLATASSMGE
jgi:hypothetical protein